MGSVTNATIVIIRSGQYVVLGVKKKGAQIGAGKLNAPGGRQEKGELLLACAAREVKEELNITIDISDLRHLGILECYAGGALFQKVFVCYTECYDGTPTETASMVPELVPFDQLPFERMHEGDRHWFPLAVAGKQFGKVRLWYKEPGEGFIKCEFA